MKETRRMVTALLALILALSLCACGSSPNGSSSSIPWLEESSSGESHPIEEETPTAVPETLPEDTTELKVPLQMTEPWEDVYPSGESGYSTQDDADACRQWLYDLRAGDITGMYGVTMPQDHYWVGEMSLEESRQIVDLLRSVAPYLAPLESGNPPTGGGWDLAILTGEETVGFGFNGEWLTFIRDGKGWVLDGTDPAVQQSLGEIDTLLWYYGYMGRSPSEGPPEYPVAPTETYFSDDVQAIYAIDRENYVMAEVKDGYSGSKWIWDELQKRVPSDDGEPSGYGFLIITDEGKEYIYMDTEEVALNKYCLAALNGPLHPSWLIHMTPERIEKISMSGASTTTDRNELLAVAKFLREEITVRPTAAIYDGFVNPDMVAGLYDWRITFDSGVEYTLMGYASEGSLTVYTSDLNKHVSYELDEGVDWKFIEFEGRDWP